MEVKIDADELCELRAAKKKLEDGKPFDWHTAGTVAGLQNRCINLEAENKWLREWYEKQKEENEKLKQENDKQACTIAGLNKKIKAVRWALH